MDVRELVTRFVFKADTAAVEQFDAAIANIKAVAIDAGEAFAGATEGIIEALGGVTEQSTATGEAIDAAFASVPEGAEIASRGIIALGEKFAALKAQAIEAGAAMRNAMGMGAAGGAAGAEEGAVASSAAGHGGGMGHMGKMLAGFVGIEAGMEMVEGFSKFQQNLQKAGANMLASKAEIQKMNDAAIGMASSLNQTPEELSEALMEIGLQGVKANDALKVLPVAARFSKAVMASPTESAELIASTTRNFYGKDFSKAGHVGDVLSRVHELGGIKAQDLLDSMKYIAPTAHAMGQSFESIAADIATLGQAGIKGSSAGTVLRSMLLRSAAPRRLTNKTMPMLFPGRHLAKGEIATIWSELGITTEDSHHNTLPLANLFEQLKSKTSHMGTATQAKMFNAAFGLEGVTGAQVLSKSTSIGDNHAAIGKSADNLKRVYDIMVGSGLIASWDKLKANAGAAAAMFMETLTPSLEVGVRWMAKLASGLVSVGGWFSKTPIAMGAFKIALDAIGFLAAVSGLNALVIAVNTKMIPALIRSSAFVWSSVKAFFGYIASIGKAIIAAGAFVVENALVIGTVGLLAAGLILMWAAFDSGNPIVQRINKALADATNGFWGLGKLIASNPVLAKLFGITASGSDSAWKHGAPGTAQYKAWMASQLHPTVPLAPRAPGRGGDVHHHAGAKVAIHITAPSGDAHAIGTHSEMGVRRALASAARQVPRQVR